MTLQRHSQASIKLRKVFLAIAVLFTLLSLQGCEQRSLLERLKARGTLHIATVAGPLSCYLGEEGAAGLEYELASAFAKDLGMTPAFTVYPTRDAAIHAVKIGVEDMAAGFIVPSSAQRKTTYLSRQWLITNPAFVHTMGNKAFDPEKPSSSPVTVTTNSYAAELLTKKNIPTILLGDVSEEEILVLVNAGQHPYALSNNAQLDAHANLLPHLVAGTRLNEVSGVRWLFGEAYDDSLRAVADRFLHAREQSGLLQQLEDKYISGLPKRDFVTRRDFWMHVQDRLPDYLGLFQQAGAETGIDWRLLAAIGYQESHWNPKAASPTGVRGIMMLTRDTARQQRIADRLDPWQSINGGARHLLWMEKRIPARIQGKNLLWFTLASYNIGYGHLEDARVLTQRQNGNPDRWDEVKQRLPLLAQKKYYKTLKHGYARGREPVTYVENIRYYYRLLVYWDNAANGKDCTDNTQLRLALKN